MGTLFGIILITTDGSSLVLPAQLALILEQSPYDIHSLTRSLATIVPDIDIDWSRIEVEWEGLKARIPEPWKLNNDGREFKVGEKLKEEGLSAKYPVILVPGIISTVRTLTCFPEYYSGICRISNHGLHPLSTAAFSVKRSGVASSKFTIVSTHQIILRSIITA